MDRCTSLLQYRNFSKRLSDKEAKLLDAGIQTTPDSHYVFGIDGKRIIAAQPKREIQYGLSYGRTGANGDNDQRGPRLVIADKKGLVIPL